MTDDFDVTDITAIREQGDLRAFMRSRIRRPAQTKPAPTTPRPGHNPGAWPAGTRPVDRGHRLNGWGPEWDAALTDYRERLREEDEEEQDQ